MLLSLLDAQDSCFLGHVALMGVIESWSSGLEKSGDDYPVTQSHIPEKPDPQMHSSEKTRISDAIFRILR